MEAILRKERINEWAAAIGASSQVHGPHFADGIWAFTAFDAAAGLELDHGNTVRPPKGYVMPQREVLYRFRQERGGKPEITATVPDPEPTVVFGVRPCDGRAMVRNDKVMGCGFADPYYQARRDKVALVGLACSAPPSPNCFCRSVGGSPLSEDGLDVLMTELDGRYHVKSLTPRGQALLDAARNLFDDVTAADSAALETARTAALGHPQRAVANQEEVAESLKRHFESPRWEELARACIGCGACTYLCPTCHCFDINDEVTSKSPVAGVRVRTWDNCQFPDFTMHTSGHNPRDDTGTRLRQRISHKFLYFVENHGIQQCTGCGRCITECPVGVDIVNVIEKVGAPA